MLLSNARAQVVDRRLSYAERGLGLVLLLTSPHQAHSCADQRKPKRDESQDPKRGYRGVSPDEFAQAVEPAIAVRPHRPSREVSVDILGKLVGRAIAPLRLFLKGLEHNQLEI